MRSIAAESIRDSVASLARRACLELGQDVIKALHKAREAEHLSTARRILDMLLENAQVARREAIPLCQDTGMAVVFCDVGQAVQVTGGNLTDAINAGVRKGYKENFLRKSVCDPLTRRNTGDNTPAVIHYDIVPGDRLRLLFAPKGFGAENMSRVVMLTPAQGLAAAQDFVVDTVKRAGANPCPPVIVGVGLGGTLEKAALCAKRALLRRLETPNADAELQDLERQWLREINRLNIGPQGLGGNTTALAVHIQRFATHIAGLPVAVNLQCHSARHASVVL